MCVRFSPLTAEEAQSVLDARGTGRHAIRYIEHPDPRHDARPGSTVPLFVPDGACNRRVARPGSTVPLFVPDGACNRRVAKLGNVQFLAHFDSGIASR